MAAAANRRAVLLGAAAFLYAVVFGADLTWEHPGLGIGHGFYLAIAVLALAGGLRLGAAAGVLAVVLYAAATVTNPHVSSSDVLSAATAIRAVTFVSMGALVGWYAGANRRLVGELEVLARRDVLTGLPNTRAFEAAITRRLDTERPFTLLLGDMDALTQLNHERGHAQGNDELRAVAERLRGALGPDDDVARVGDDEFAVLASASTTDEAAQLATRLERLASRERTITFGWSSFPQDGINALSLFRAADERLYARKFVHGRRFGEAPPSIPRTG